MSCRPKCQTDECQVQINQTDKYRILNLHAGSHDMLTIWFLQRHL